MGEHAAEHVPVSVTVPDGVRVNRVTVWVDIADERELTRAIDAFGGVERFQDVQPYGRLVVLERGGVEVNLWLSETMAPAFPMVPALERLRARQDAAKAHASRERATANAEAWARDVGRPVGVEDGKVVETNG